MNSIMNWTDAGIVKAFNKSETQEVAFNKLVNTYSERLYWHIRRIVIDHEDSNDVLQNTFIKIYKNLSKFRGQSKLYTWLYRVATNEAINFLNKKRKRFFIPVHDVEQEMCRKLKSDHYFDGDEVKQKLQQAVLKLPEKQRIVFNLRYFEEMKYDDISEVLGTSAGALKASYHHAVKKIEEYFK